MVRVREVMVSWSTRIATARLEMVLTVAGGKPETENSVAVGPVIVDATVETVDTVTLRGGE